MTIQAQREDRTMPVEAGRQIAQLRHVLHLVEELGGISAPRPSTEEALDRGARVSSAYAHALPIVQRRFDALAAETATWSAVAAEALLAAGGRSSAAARQLARELRAALSNLSELVGA